VDRPRNTWRRQRVHAATTSWNNRKRDAMSRPMSPAAGPKPSGNPCSIFEFDLYRRFCALGLQACERFPRPCPRERLITVSPGKVTAGTRTRLRYLISPFLLI